MTPEHAQVLPDALKALGPELPAVLLGYQARLLATTAVNPVTICEKSRRIGMTWAVGADAVLTAGAARTAGGMDVLYIGYNLDMAREFIDVCAMWARAFMPGASEVGEFLFRDQDDKGADRDIQAFRISFASGFEIVALTSKPRSLRGRQGYLIFDEAAFHDDLAGMMKAGLAFLMWGGKILVISTHDGETNPFNGLVNDSRAGRKPYAVVRVTFEDAIADGLYERVALMAEARGLTIKPKAEWISEIRAYYGDDGDEELDCVPAQGSGTALTSALIEARMRDDIPVVVWQKTNAFAQVPLPEREAECRGWCDDNLAPLLAKLDPELQSFFGEDFGRKRDATDIWPLQMQKNLVRRPPFVCELLNIPYEQQRQVLFYIVDRLPRFMAGALDATGNGGFLAEAAADRYGHTRIAQVMLNIEWYRENMPPWIAAFEDGTVELPKDANVLADHRLLKKIDGVVRVPPIRTQDANDKSKKRHGDSAVAHALAFFASRMPIAEYDYRPATADAGGLNRPNHRDDRNDDAGGSGVRNLTGAY